MDMYSKSGRLGLAIRIFDEILDKDVFSWTTMISGYAYHGKGQHVLEAYSRMLESKVTPNEATPLSLLTAWFLEEAKEMIELMPMEPDTAIWRSFLTACLVHGNLNLTVIAARKVIELEPSDDGLYMLLWNAYYAANMWKEALEVRKLMRTSKVRRKPGCSWVEGNGIVQEFHAGDTLLHYSYELCLLLEELKELSKTELF
ncbi:pentatricopeptide repeat-containing protein At2g20540-like [Neltuma alba]|uniref:pentatricopeptide repeat-containing protein At2g20540-like n=1 Tax=Neltuma alba TaxID=207710 RepID=UPI0010A41369|nr:pentatricopeptide repeat-containing protein At2g20540-like [Prosopis alba]